MKIKTICFILITIIFNTSLNIALAQNPPKMEMTTPIPEGIATPDKLKTSLGTLNSFDGVPDEETTQLVYDNLDLQRAINAFLSSIQIAYMVRTGK